MIAVDYHGRFKGHSFVNREGRSAATFDSNLHRLRSYDLDIDPRYVLVGDFVTVVVDSSDSRGKWRLDESGFTDREVLVVERRTWSAEGELTVMLVKPKSRVGL